MSKSAPEAPHRCTSDQEGHLYTNSEIFLSALESSGYAVTRAPRLHVFLRYKKKIGDLKELFCPKAFVYEKLTRLV